MISLKSLELISMMLRALVFSLIGKDGGSISGSIVSSS
jgi:hypothetical protein